jgi:hypothetical protein
MKAITAMKPSVRFPWISLPYVALGMVGLLAFRDNVLRGAPPSENFRLLFLAGLVFCGECRRRAARPWVKWSLLAAQLLLGSTLVVVGHH